MNIDLEKVKAYCDEHICNRECTLYVAEKYGTGCQCVFSEASWADIEAAFEEMEKEVKNEGNN